MSHIWFFRTVYFTPKDRIISAKGPFIFNNFKNRAASRILIIRIFMKDCDIYFFERLLNLSKLKFKRSFTERLRNLYIWKILQSFCERTICSLVLKDFAIFRGERMLVQKYFGDYVWNWAVVMLVKYVGEEFSQCCWSCKLVNVSTCNFIHVHQHSI